MRGAIAVEMIAATGAPRTGLGGDFNAAFELVAARTGHCIDHATGGAAELDRVATGLDLEFLEEGERRGAEATTGIHVGDIQAVDEDRVLGHR
uniref:Uncharacterized protein n=1 Tax=Panagrolaimus superbus TaxID=310955 RepID=A0A914YIC1_9BILA